MISHFLIDAGNSETRYIVPIRISDPHASSDTQMVYSSSPVPCLRLRAHERNLASSAWKRPHHDPEVRRKQKATVGASLGEFTWTKRWAPFSNLERLDSIKANLSSSSSSFAPERRRHFHLLLAQMCFAWILQHVSSVCVYIYIIIDYCHNLFWWLRIWAWRLGYLEVCEISHKPHK